MIIKFTDNEVKNVKLIRIDTYEYGRIVLLKQHSNIITNGVLHSYDIGDSTIEKSLPGTFVFNKDILIVI